jgi:hypothetical protein
MNAASFLLPWGTTVTNTESQADLPTSAGTAHALMLVVSPALGVGQSASLTFRRNATDTLLTCTIPAGGSTCSDFVNSVTLADFDSLSLRYDEVGNPNVRVKYSFVFQTN